MKRISESDQFISKVTAVETVKYSLWTRLVNTFGGWRERRQAVKILRGLSSSQLKDIGLSCRDIDKLYGHRDDSRKVWPNWPK